LFENHGIKKYLTLHCIVYFLNDLIELNIKKNGVFILGITLQLKAVSYHKLKIILLLSLIFW